MRAVAVCSRGPDPAAGAGFAVAIPGKCTAPRPDPSGAINNSTETPCRKAFREMGEKPAAERCAGIEGIKAEHDEFMKQKPAPVVRDLFLTGAGARVEHYEIAAYTGLVTMGQALGEKAVVRLLKENLAQEKEALRRLEAISKRIAKGESPAARAA
jgi:hypothetical protein